MWYNSCLSITEQQERNILRSMPECGEFIGLAQFFSLFADSTRLKILSALCMKELCVADICFLIKAGQSTVSHQLRLLKDAKIVDCRRAGKLILYTVVNPYVNDIMLTGARQLAVR